MRIIAHRGNLRGPTTEESFQVIRKALERGFDVEIDVHVEDGKLVVGHDVCLGPVPDDLLYSENRSRIWFHAKNPGAVARLPDHSIYFSHQDDPFTTVHSGNRLVWIHPSQNGRLKLDVASGVIDPTSTVLLDVGVADSLDRQYVFEKGFFGVCTDWAISWAKDYVAWMV